MASIIGTVVDGNMLLIGLKVKTKHCEIYGGSCTDKIEARCTIDELLQRKLVTAQMDFSGTRPLIKGQFHLYDLPMEIYMGGNYAPYNNEIEVVGRFTNDKKDVGYRVKSSTGVEYDLPTAKIDNLVLIMRPRNFVVRHDDSGKPFIAAKNGRIAELPVIADLANRSAKGSDKRNVVKVDSSNLSFEGILNMIASMNGFFAYIPGFVYRAYSKQSSADKAANESIYAGQIASPQIVPTASSANINLRFKGLAKVEVPRADGSNMELFPVLYREKSVYRNGKLALDTVGIVAEKKHEEVILQQLAGASPFVISDKPALEYFSRIIGRTPGQITLVGISLIGIKPYASIAPADYNTLAFNINAHEQVKEALKAIKKVEREFLESKGATFNKVHSALEGYSDEELNAIALAGIDIKSFTLVKKATEEDNAATDAEKAKAAAAAKSIKLNWTVELNDVAEQKKAKDIEDLIKVAQGYADNGDGDGLAAFVEQTDKAADNLKKVIWEANKAVLAQGESKILLPADSKGVKFDDVTTARMKTSKAAQAATTIPGIVGIKLTVNNAENSALVL